MLCRSLARLRGSFGPQSPPHSVLLLLPIPSAGTFLLTALTCPRGGATSGTTGPATTTTTSRELHTFSLARPLLAIFVSVAMRWGWPRASCPLKDCLHSSSTMTAHASRSIVSLAVRIVAVSTPACLRRALTPWACACAHVLCGVLRRTGSNVRSSERTPI